MYEYRAHIIRVIDGDTVWAEIDLGLDVRHFLTLRLEGINAPERGTSEGAAATEFLLDMVFNAPTPLRLETVKDRREKYGRYRAWLFHPTEHWSLNNRMVEAGHAVYSEG